MQSGSAQFPATIAWAKDIALKPAECLFCQVRPPLTPLIQATHNRMLTSITSTRGTTLNLESFDNFHEMIFRLCMATVLGGVLGIDRDLHHKPAGIRVLSLVCLGSAAICIGSINAFSSVTKPPTDGVLRTIQGVLSGIGFLGGGVILRTQGRNEIHGMTTAASIWVASILGMICGMGEWLLGLCSFGLAWAVLVAGRWVEEFVLAMAPPPKPDDTPHD